MLTELLAFAAGIVFLIALAVVSMRGAHRERRTGDRGPIIPVGDHHDHFGDHT
ncbi:MAG: hypothetical protein U1E03_00935 [Hyphomonadaceae bacterium]